SAARGESLVRSELSAEAIRLARLLRALLPEPAREPVRELDGLLALMLIHDARRGARVDAAGALVVLAEQGRTRWDRAQLEEGLGAYPPWHATRAALLRRLGRSAEATAAYERAHALAQNQVERRFLERRLATLGRGS